jgi:hypothetical protein
MGGSPWLTAVKAAVASAGVFIFLNNYCDAASNVEEKTKFQFFNSSFDVRTDED